MSEWITKELPYKIVGDWSGHFSLLWHSNYYDGFMEGMALDENRSARWLYCFGEKTVSMDRDDGDCPEQVAVRFFHVLELTPAQTEWRENSHELFRQRVGRHCDYDGDGHRVKCELCSQEVWKEFYDAMKADPTQHCLNKDQIRGWCTQMDFRPRGL